MSSSTTYSATAKLLHWLIFALLTAQVLVGEIMPHIGRTTLNEGWVAWHLWIGAVILFTIVLRLVWRALHPVSPAPELPQWQRRLSLAVHWALYALVLVNAVLGWAAASYRGWDVMLFGLIPLPALAAKGTSWAHTAGDVHVVLVYVLLGLIALHVAGALYHHFVQRDGVLKRMLPD